MCLTDLLFFVLIILGIIQVILVVREKNTMENIYEAKEEFEEDKL